MSNRHITSAALLVALAAGGVGTVATAGGASASERSATAGTSALPAPGSKALGWTAAIQHPRSAEDDAAHLVMVSPTGATQTVGAVSDDAAMGDVSYDARHVITYRILSDRQTKVAIWDVAAKHASIATINTGYGVQVAFAGGGWIAGNGGYIWRYDLSGRYLKQLPRQKDSTGIVASTPGGSHIMESVTTGVAVRDATTGALLHRVSNPRGTTGCAPVSGWDAASFQMACSTGDGLGSERAYRAGFTAAVATSALSPIGFDRTYPSAPRVGSGESGGLGEYAVVNPTTVGPLLPMHGEAGGGVGTKFWATDESGPLKVYDLATRRATTVLGGVVMHPQTVDGS